MKSLSATRILRIFASADKQNKRVRKLKQEEGMRMMKITKQELIDAKGQTDAIGKTLQLAHDAYEFIETLPEKQKQLAQLGGEIESQERIKAKLAAEIADQERKLKDLSTKVTSLEAKHGKSLRADDLDRKISEKEAALRLANERWAQLVKKVETASAA